MSAGAKRLEFAHHSDILLVDGGGDMRVDLLVGRPCQRPKSAFEVVDAVVERAWFPWEIRKVLLDLLVGIPDLGHAHVGLVQEEDLAVSEVEWCDAHKTRLDEPYTRSARPNRQSLTLRIDDGLPEDDGLHHAVRACRSAQTHPLRKTHSYPR